MCLPRTTASLTIFTSHAQLPPSHVLPAKGTSRKSASQPAIMKRLYRRFVTDPPLPPPGSFKDQTVVVTGGTTGLGLAAATHFLALGAAKVVITCRNAARGEAARQKIEQEAKSSSSSSAHGIGRVEVVELDMSNFDSCVAFVRTLKSRYANGGRGVDILVLNAGVIPYRFGTTDDGWNESLQVNTLATTLIAGLAVTWMRECRGNRQDAARVVLVSSGTHLAPNISSWPGVLARGDGGVLAHYNDEANWPGFNAMYAISKLLLMYAFEELVKLAGVGKDGKPLVIVNSLCPGPVATDLSRDLTGKNPLLRPLLLIFQATQTVGPDYGSRIYITTSKAGGVETHGRFLTWYQGEADYQKAAKKVLYSPEAREVQAGVWKEILSVLSARSPEFAVAVRSG